MKTLFLLIFIVLSYGSDKTCLDGKTYIWGLDFYLHTVPGTTFICQGMISCYQLLQAIHKINGVEYVMMKPTNEDRKQISVAEYTDNYAHVTFIIGGHCSDYKIMPGATTFCQGLSSCNEAICSVRETSGVSLIVAVPVHD